MNIPYVALKNLKRKMTRTWLLLLIVMAGTLISPEKYPYNIAIYVGVGWIPISAIMTAIEYKLHPENVKSAGQFTIEGIEGK